jgi:hypothetical protein
MANRPCRTDADLKDIWRLLLPGTPLPACETSKNSGDEKRQNAEPPPADDTARLDRARDA